MAYRIVEISHPAEIHVRDGQLLVEQDKGTASIPVEDISLLIASGPGIRMSTMAQTILADNNVMLILMGKNHLPSALSIPMVANARQALATAKQAELTPQMSNELWKLVVTRKIENQARALSILGLYGAARIFQLSEQVYPGDPGNIEGQAAREYFQFLQPGLNRRKPGPLNSALNYGYAIIRSAVARSLVIAGFIPALGIHHRNQLNAFNLADDIMEPFRPCVDLVAVGMGAPSDQLDSSQRRDLRQVLENAILLDGLEVQVKTAIEKCVDSLRDAIVNDDSSLLELPIVVPTKLMSGIRE